MAPRQIDALSELHLLESCGPKHLDLSKIDAFVTSAMLKAEVSVYPRVAQVRLPFELDVLSVE
jgi:hypothetical protein